MVAISPTTPDIGNIRVQIYIATVIGIKPIGFLSAFKISSSIFDSVLSASLPSELRITEIMKPLNRNAISITASEEIIEPKSTPKKPRFQTSLTIAIKLSIFKYFVIENIIL